jgi:ribosomal protein L12E/L44/L45/RPP1/RPP2
MDSTVDKQPAVSHKNRYSDRTKQDALLVLDAVEGDCYQAAAVTGIPTPTLYDWRAGRGVPPDVKARAQAATERLADGFQELAEKLVASALADSPRIDRANIQQVVMAAAVSVDKMRLLREQATSIHTQQLSDEERIARLNELLATALTLPAAAHEQEEGEQPALPAPALEQPDADDCT